MDRQPRPVAATTVFPALRGRAWPLPTGIVAAYSWRAAVQAALLDLCRRLTIAELPAATTPFPRLDPHRHLPDGPGRRFLSILAAIGGVTVAYDVTGTLGVPTVLCHHDCAPAGCASGRTVAEALEAALLQTVLGYQAARDGWPADAGAPPPTLPARLRGDPVRSGVDDAPHDLTTIGAALAGLGHHPVVVPLDHDPEVAAVMPYIATVVLADG
jgi:ribosomal protein S12 methylthiotransferase accessory factor YcaO